MSALTALRGAAARAHALGAQAPHGKLTPAKRRALTLLARAQRPLALARRGVYPQTLRALLAAGLVVPAPSGYQLTGAGAVAIARYAPRTRR